MKTKASKIIAVILCFLMIMGSSVSVFAVSKADSKTGQFISKLKDKKEITVKIKDSFFDEITEETNGMIKLSDAKIQAKFGNNNIQLAASIKAFGFVKVKALFKDGNLYAYIPLLRLKVNITDVLKMFGDMEEIEIEEIIGTINDIIDKLTNYFEFLELKEAGNKDIPGHDNVYCEVFGADLKAAVKYCIDSGIVKIPADVNYNSMSDEELVAYLKSLDVPAESEEIEADYKTYDEVMDYACDFVFLYNGNDLIDVLLCQDGEYSGSIGEIPIESISVGVNSLDFITPIFYFELSFLANFIVNIISNL